jgi:hypothetical protein
MESLERRLKALEDRYTPGGWQLDPEELRSMRREELDELEEVVEAEVIRGERSFWDLYSVVSVKSQRSLESFFSAMEAHRRVPGEVREREPPTVGYKEVLRKAGNGRNGYRIWKYHPGGPIPEDLRRKLYAQNRKGLET